MDNASLPCARAQLCDGTDGDAAARCGVPFAGGACCRGAVPPYARGVARVGVLASLGAGVMAGVGAGALAHGANRAWSETVRQLASKGYGVVPSAMVPDMFWIRAPEYVLNHIVALLRDSAEHTTRGMRRVAIAGAIEAGSRTCVCSPCRANPLSDVARTVCLVAGAGLAVTLLAVGACMLWHRASRRRRARAREELLRTVKERTAAERPVSGALPLAGVACHEPCVSDAPPSVVTTQ